MLRVCIVGCGRIADQHAAELKYVANGELVGVCDSELLMAEQMAERFGVGAAFNDVGQMLKELSPDVVHITTPPQSHFALGVMCLEAGANVFMEKPITIDAVEAEKLIDLANAKGLKLTVGHNAQFNHATVQMRKLIQSGCLGGDPVHIESTWCYPFTDPGYAKAILGDANHWIRKLPGQYLHDIISHGICRIAEFMTDENPEVRVIGFTSHFLQDIGEDEIVDELRVQIKDESGLTGYYTFSSQIAPPIKRLRVYGKTGSLLVDNEHQTVLRVPSNSKYYLNHFLPPLVDAWGNVKNALRNMYRFLKADFHFESGRRLLINRFYDSVENGSPLPISYKEILINYRIMDKIFSQLADKE